MALALSEDIPVVGVLKDVNSGLCSLKSVFDCARAISEAADSAIWLQIKPRDVIGCEVNIIDIHRATGQKRVIETVDVVTQRFERDVLLSLQRSAAQRDARLKVAPRYSAQIEALVAVFERNPDVVAEVRSRAGAICQACKNISPFRRRADGLPYLEVHHRITLANGGPDTVQWTTRSRFVRIAIELHTTANFFPRIAIVGWGPT